MKIAFHPVRESATTLPGVKFYLCACIRPIIGTAVKRAMFRMPRALLITIKATLAIYPDVFIKVKNQISASFTLNIRTIRASHLI